MSEKNQVRIRLCRPPWQNRQSALPPFSSSLLVIRHKRERTRLSFLVAKLSLQSSELGRDMDTDLAWGQGVLC